MLVIHRLAQTDTNSQPCALYSDNTGYDVNRRRGRIGRIGRALIGRAVSIALLYSRRRFNDNPCRRDPAARHDTETMANV